ncbi:hypothetical protein N431DRAFT_439742 [Stipitochalara longipes BDJ]|nr:hypothetical protein N431DRAFT_439742 [Stipitochalara longipes BDJ]
MKPSFLALSLSLASLVLAQSSTPPCVASCETTSPASSTCNGDETGAALDQCNCQSLIGTNLITCIKACPSDQVSVFAAGVPSLCRGTLFPGVSVSSTGGAAATTSAGTGTGNGGAATTTSKTASPTGSPSPSSTVKAGGGSGAAVKGRELSTSFAAAVMGGVFALLML